MTKKEISLSGMRTTGALHLGHYLGAMQNFIKMDTEYDSYLMLSDLQALNDNFHDVGKIRSSVIEILADLYALNLKNTTIFIESQIPEIAELTVYFANLIQLNRLTRNPTIKSEIASKQQLFGANGESVNLGMIVSPVSQAADVAIVKATKVPVGEDQLPMLEVGRDIVSKFNKLYSNNVLPDILPLFEPITTSTPRIYGLDGNAKMSKSLNNAIFMQDSEEETIAKMKKAKTDSISEIYFDENNRPEVSNLLLIYSSLTGITIEEAVANFKNQNFSAFKTEVASAINNHFKLYRERRQYAMNNQSVLIAMAKSGQHIVAKKAGETMNNVRAAMGINYF